MQVPSVKRNVLMTLGKSILGWIAPAHPSQSVAPTFSLTRVSR